MLKTVAFLTSFVMLSGCGTTRWVGNPKLNDGAHLIGPTPILPQAEATADNAPVLGEDAEGKDVVLGPGSSVVVRLKDSTETGPTRVRRLTITPTAIEILGIRPAGNRARNAEPPAKLQFDRADVDAVGKWEWETSPPNKTAKVARIVLGSVLLVGALMLISSGPIIEDGFLDSCAGCI